MAVRYAERSERRPYGHREQRWRKPRRLLSETRLWSGSGKSADFPRHPVPGAVGQRATCQDYTSSSSKRCPFQTRYKFKAAALARASTSTRGEVARRFACPKPSKAGLCPWPQVTGTDCAVTFKEMISRVLDFLPEIRFPRIRAGEEERQRGMPFAQSRPSLRLFWRLHRFTWLMTTR